jgi:hypothetical protein
MKKRRTPLNRADRDGQGRTGNGSPRTRTGDVFLSVCGQRAVLCPDKL